MNSTPHPRRGGRAAVPALILLALAAGLAPPARADLPPAALAEAQGDYPKALELWGETVAAESGETTPAARSHLESYLRAQAALGRWDDLDTAAAKAAARFPGWDVPLILRARALEARGRPGDGAELLAGEAGTSYPAAVERARLLTVIGRRDDADAIMSRVVQAYDPNAIYSPPDLLAFGRAAVARGDYQGGSHMMQVAFADSNGFVEARLALGYLFQEKYQAKLAGDELTGAATVAPGHPDVALAGARLNLLNNGLDRAEELAHRVLAARPGDPGATAVLARVALLAQEADRGRALAEAALARVPTDRELRGLVAAAAYLQGDSTAFHREENAVLEQDPGYMDAYLDLADILGNSRRNREAIAVYHRVLDRDPDNAAARTGIGLLAMREGDEAEARSYLEEGFKGDRFNIRAYNQLELLDKMDTFATYRSGPFEIRLEADTDSLLVPLLEASLDSTYRDLVALHGWKPKQPTVVEVFPDHHWFSARVTGLPWVGGIPAVCFGDVIATDSPRTLSGTSNWEQILRHEFGHVLALGMTDKKVPFWFTEGLSVHLEQYPRGKSWDENLKAAYEDGGLVPVDSLTLAFTRPKAFSQRLLAYHESGLIIDDIVASKGWDVIPKLLAAFGRGKDLPTAVEEVLGESYADFTAHALEVVRKEAASLNVWPAQDPDRLARLEEEAKTRPDDPRFLERLALARFQMGQADAASEAAKHLLKLEPDNPRALGVLALADQRADRPQDATRESLRRAVAVGSRDVPVYLALAGIQTAARDTAAALATYARALDLYPLEMDALHRRAQLFLASGDTAAARREYRTLLSRSENEAGPAVELARLELASGNGAAAARALDYAVAVVPLDADVEALRGQAYLLENRDREAFTLFTRARKLDLRSVETMVGMARYYLRQDDLEEAAYYAQLALKYQPGHPVAKEVLAEAQAW